MWKKISKVRFEGRPGGDMECFCWHDVPIEDILKIKGRERFEEDRDLEEECERGHCRDLDKFYDPQVVARRIRTLYPDEVIGDAGRCKNYRFTIIVEEKEDEPN